MGELTVKEAADLLQISVSTVYRRLDAKDPAKECQIKKDGVTYITAAGLALLGLEGAADDKPPAGARELQAELIQALREQIADQKAELAEKNEIIKSLSSLANANAVLLAQQQQLLLAENSQSDNQTQNYEKDMQKDDKGLKRGIISRLRDIMKKE